MFLSQVIDCKYIAQRFRHLLCAQGQHVVVQPVAHIVFGSVGAAALGSLVLMVREDQIPPAAVDVDGFTQVGTDHRRALQVPARPATPPGTIPAWIVFSGGLPQHEVTGMSLVISNFHPSARQHVIQAAVRQFTVVLH